MIHSTAIIHPKAELDPSVNVGPYAVIDEAVRVGARCRIGPHVHLTGHTEIGEDNVFHSNCVIGDGPQDLKYRDAPTRLRVGSQNVFREQVTVHRSNNEEEDTVVGDRNYFMVNSHVGHNCRIGSHVILANGAMVGGHVQISDHVFISGNCLIHQFVRIGTLAMMQGGAGISRDLPPYTMARGANRICGLNVVGLRRAGISAADRAELNSLYHALFRDGLPLRQAIESNRERFSSAHAHALLDFVASSRRGVCIDFTLREDPRENAADIQEESGSAGSSLEERSPGSP